jgi:hypothetical protein
MHIDKINEQIQGKKVKELNRVGDWEVQLVFDDDTFVQFEISERNTSCHCHPEYEYKLQVECY